MMEAEIYAIRKALKLLNHDDHSTRERAIEADRALDAIEAVLNSRDSGKREDLAFAEDGLGAKSVLRA